MTEARLQEAYEDTESNQPSVATEGDSLGAVQRKKSTYSKSVANFEAFARMNSMGATKTLLEKNKLGQAEKPAKRLERGEESKRSTGYLFK